MHRIKSLATSLVLTSCLAPFAVSCAERGAPAPENTAESNEAFFSLPWASRKRHGHPVRPQHPPKNVQLGPRDRKSVV